MRVVFIVFVLLFGNSALAEKLSVVTSFSILQDWVSIVGGDHVNVVSLIGRNSDPHTFRARSKDSRTIANAHLLVINGLGFEGWLPRLLETSNYNGQLLIASEGIGQRLLSASGDDGHSHPNHHTAIDAHAWHSLENAKTYIRNIETSLGTIDPSRATQYKANADAYIQQLNTMLQRYKSEFAAIAANKRNIVTAHDAFAYLSAEFDLRLYAPSSRVSGIGSSAKKIAALLETIRQNQIQAIFLERTADPRMLEQVSRETGVAIGGQLFADALSEANEPAATYVQMMTHNLNAILKALQKN